MPGLNNRTEGWVTDSIFLDPRCSSTRIAPHSWLPSPETAERPRLPRERRARDAFPRAASVPPAYIDPGTPLGPLCDAVLDTTGSAALLDQLERANLFLVPLEGRNAYRYHPCSRPCSGAGSSEEPEVTLTLHARASAWLEEHAEVDAAVEHAIASHDIARASDLVATQFPPPRTSVR